jgi:hypothetical protein
MILSVPRPAVTSSPGSTPLPNGDGQQPPDACPERLGVAADTGQHATALSSQIGIRRAGFWGQGFTG